MEIDMVMATNHSATCKTPVTKSWDVALGVMADRTNRASTSPAPNERGEPTVGAEVFVSSSGGTLRLVPRMSRLAGSYVGIF